MDSLPSYQAAITRPSPLKLAAPYVRFADYRALCLVSRQVWSLFAPRLWGDILQAVRLTGLDPGDDINWWLDFVFDRLHLVRLSTRALVHVLDAREFGKDAYDFWSDQHERTFQQSFHRALRLLPEVKHILLDGHTNLDPGFLIGSPQTADQQHRLELLSVAYCPFQLPNSFFSSPSLDGLVYLDASQISGSIRSLLQPNFLPALRVLKVRGREIDDGMMAALLNRFGLQLWSLDLSHNNITDVISCRAALISMPGSTVRSAAHVDVEGQLVLSELGTTEYGPFVTIKESDWSRSFDHPARYFVDPPVYTASADTEPQESTPVRGTGRNPIRHDSVNHIRRTLSGANGKTAAYVARHSRRLTHLNISNNHISAGGIEALLRKCNGRLQNLVCGPTPLLSTLTCQPLRHSPKPVKLCGIHGGDGATHVYRPVKLFGTVGIAHIFRPMFSSNLSVLQVDHSLVTNIPTLEVEGLSALARLYLSETALLSRISAGYPQTYIPDMNPRLSSLTLTGLPRRSSGPLIGALIGFLTLLSAQERSIQESTLSPSWRQSRSMLRGLRHLTLEFAPDPMEDPSVLSEVMDAEDTLTTGGVHFGAEEVEVSSTGARLESEVEKDKSSGAYAVTQHPNSGRNGEFVSYENEWCGSSRSSQVWVGPVTPGLNPVINKYRSLVVDHGMRSGFGPATPVQVLAGAPEDTFVFHSAWALALMPSELTMPPRNALLAMNDVIDELKKFRLAGRAKFAELTKLSGSAPVPSGEPHNFWTGKLQVVIAE